MIIAKRGIVVALAFVLALTAASMGFSQSGGTNGSPSTTSTSTGIATAQSTNIFGGSSSQVQVLPGVAGTPGVFPGYPEQNGKWDFYWNPMFREIPDSEAEVGRGKHDKIQSKTLLVLPKNRDPIHLLSWVPFNPASFYSDDREAYTGIVDGKPGEPIEETLLAGIYDAKTKSHTDRCIAWARVMNEGITKGFSIGTGGAGAMTPGPGTNNMNTAFAAGGLLGKNITKEANYFEIRLVCLNKGSFDPPEPPKQDESAKPATPTAPPAQPQPQPAAPQTTNPEPNVGALISLFQQLLASKHAPTPTTPASSPTDACADLPKDAIYFRFNISVVDPQYLPVIKSVEDWMVQHPSCKVSIEGYASFEGGDHYNDGLGQDRAQHVYDILAKNKDIVDRLPRHLSGGKRFVTHRSPNPENTREDRKVIFAIRNITSEQ